MLEELNTTYTKKQNEDIIINNIKEMIASYACENFVDKNQVSEINESIKDSDIYSYLTLISFLSDYDDSNDSDFIAKYRDDKVSEDCIQQIINLRQDVLIKIRTFTRTIKSQIY
jgi:hypothetical protein